MLERLNWFGDEIQLTHLLETRQGGNEIIIMRVGMLEHRPQLDHVFEHKHLQSFDR